MDQCRLKPGWRRAGGWCAASVLLCAVAVAQDQTYREQQVLDPDSETWVDARALPEVGDNPTLGEARSLLARGEPDDARRLLKTWVKDNPDDPLRLEGVYLLGEAYFLDRDYYKAYEQYEIVVDNGAGDLFVKALRREMDCARAFLAGKPRWLWGFLPLPAQDDGIKILDRVWERAPGTQMGEDALRIKADYYFERGEMDLAKDEYILLAREYPNGRAPQQALLRSAEAAQAAFPGVKFDDRALVDAEERYRIVQTRFPDFAAQEGVDARLRDVRDRLAQKDLEVARWYKRVNEPTAAAFYYRQILADYPETVAAGQAQVELKALNIAEPAGPVAGPEAPGPMSSEESR